jgi:hypothetical protein
MVHTDVALWTDRDVHNLRALLNCDANLNPLYGLRVGGWGRLDGLGSGDPADGTFTHALDRAATNGIDAERPLIGRHLAALRYGFELEQPTEQMSARVRELFEREPRDLSADDWFELRTLVVDLPRQLRPEGHNYRGESRFSDVIERQIARSPLPEDDRALQRYWLVYRRVLDPSVSTATVSAAVDRIMMRSPEQWTAQQIVQLGSFLDHLPRRIENPFEAWTSSEAAEAVWGMLDGGAPPERVRTHATYYRATHDPKFLNTLADRLDAGESLDSVIGSTDMQDMAARELLFALVDSDRQWTLAGARQFTKLLNNRQGSTATRYRVMMAINATIQRELAPLEPDAAAAAQKITDRNRERYFRKSPDPGDPGYSNHLDFADLGKLRSLLEYATVRVEQAR